jgi:hypothetical protein
MNKLIHTFRRVIVNKESISLQYFDLKFTFKNSVKYYEQTNFKPRRREDKNFFRLS